jgi:hypothetical protein
MHGKLAAPVLAALLASWAGCGSSHGAHVDGAIDVATKIDAGIDLPSLPPSGALRLLAPLSTATVTSRRPTLHWLLDSTADGVHVQICHDRPCTMEVAAFDAAGGGGAPASDLPAGVLFWRAYGLRNGAVTEGWTPTWQFTVGARTAPVDTSWGTTLDVNGDAYADVIVGAPGANGGAGQAFVFVGRPSGAASSPQILTAPAASDLDFGLYVASAGDVNGDGFADVIVTRVAGAYLFLGSAAGLASSPAVAIRPPGNSGPGLGSQTFGIHAASAGDVNGDGYADVVIGDNGLGAAYLFLGSATGLPSTPDLTLTGTGGFGHSVAGAGDVNGDGFADVVVGASGASVSTGQVYLYLGGATGLASSPAVTLTEPDGYSGSYGAVSSADDVNGDGYADIVVGANAASGSTTRDFAGRAYVHLGSAAGLAASPAVTLIGSEAGGAFGRWVSNAGDVNGDGYGDVVIGADGENGAGAAGSPGRAYLYFGSSAGLAAAPTVTLTGPDGPGAWFGRCAAAAGDVNGDGYADIVIGANAGGTAQAADGGVVSAVGWAHLYLGNASGVASSPAVTWTGPSVDSSFGRIVASLQSRCRRPG